MNSNCFDVEDENENVEFTSVDTAILRINVETVEDKNLALLTQSTECYSCPLLKFCNLNGRSQQLYVNTTFKTELSVVNSLNNNVLCSKTEWFGEKGFYNLTLRGSNGNYSCSIDVDKDPINSFWPILAAFFFYLGLILIFTLFRFVKRKCNQSNELDAQPLDDQISQDLGKVSPSQKPRRKRLRALDTFRGISIVVMIFVNYGGGEYWFFNHSAWNGLTVADLVFPWFMFIMGTSMSMAFEGFSRRDVSLLSKISNTIRRSVVLFLLGILINSGGGNNDLRTIRIFGVLQRFGVAYLIIGLTRSFRAVSKDSFTLKYPLLEPFRDILSCWVEWVVVLILLAVWLLLTFLLPVPGCPTGYLGPGGVSDFNYFNCTGGAAQLVDSTILTPYHMYQTPTCQPIYDTTVPYDPEGIMGCITSTFIVMLGLQAGQIVLFFSNWRDRIKRWAVWSLITGAIAAILCECKQNGGWMPINKNLWSLSYVLLMACFAYIFLIIFLLIIDVKNYWSGTPFYQAGMNSILLYLGHEILGPYLPFSWVPFTQTHWEYLAMDLWGASLWAIIAVYLDYKNFYFSV